MSFYYGTAAMVPWCSICLQTLTWDSFQQFVPCLHYFCAKCIKAYVENTKSKICPFRNCYSTIKMPAEPKWNECVNPQCNRKLSFSGEYHTATCHHLLCLECHAILNKEPVKICPIKSCGQPLNDEDLRIKCEGQCKQEKKLQELTYTLCCGARFCQQCFANLKATNRRCPPGKCVRKSIKRDHRQGENCIGSPECMNEPVRDFMPDKECRDHFMCMTCLGNMINECERENLAPHCPNEACGLFYKRETVLALRAMFPEKAKYFDKFELDAQNTEALRDDTVTKVAVTKDFNATVRCIDIKVMISDDENSSQVIQFDNTGCLGDFIREMRSALKILPTDTVYGYMIKHGDGEDEQLHVSSELNQRTVDSIGFKANTTVTIDTTGIVSKKKK